ncbi:MAG TPA: ATP-binding protein [Gemmatimonadaceae bacterium]|nr:ATP-binding protein [Gemmatimonadaceae bacterium]
MGYHQLTRALTAAATNRVASASRLLAQTFEASVLPTRAEFNRTISDSTVHRFLVKDDIATRAAAQRFIANRIAKTAQIIGIEVRGKDGRRVLWVDGPAAAKAAPLRDGHVASAPPKGLSVGPIVADHGTLFHELVIPILGSPTDTIGTASQFRQVSSAGGAQLISGLIGPDVTLLFGNTNGSWNDLSKILPGPPVTLKGPSVISYKAQDGSDRLGAWAPIKATPWLVWVDIRKSAILAPARRFLRTMALTGVLILIVGAFAAWLISRQISVPLKETALAANDISAGDYSRRVTISRQDELGVLADAFNGMAHQIEDAHKELEGRVAARTGELETALGELRDTQATLVRKEKLAMLGLLAGGVGHELRNPLGVMTNAVYYLGMVLNDSPAEVKDYLGILDTQIKLAEKIVGDLLDFARIKPPQTETIPVKQLVDEQLQRAGTLDGVTVRHDFPLDLPAVRVDRVQIGQVVLNLITNALQAMNGHGAVLTFRGRQAADGFVRLDVIDTGVGMTPEQMEKLFEPLFTTKARGIGLGLAVSRGLVQANGGAISAESSPGAGTMMSVSLPTPARGAP